MLGGCSTPPPPAPKSAEPAPAVRITQFYTTTPQVPRGEKGTVCYGVENAKAVWLSPPKRELSSSIARCVEVEPAGQVTYTLTAEGADGKTVTQDLALRSGAARVHIVNVDISAAEVKQGDVVSICYKVDNAQSVTISPVHFRAGSLRHGCVTDQPGKTTTYVVTATGRAGDTDEERVTIKVVGGR
jgi:hypothetical protein